MSHHQARKRFGQNFLNDAQVIQNIVDLIDPQEAWSLVEIGPGLGALTTPLLARTTHLDVVELDRDLVARLQADYADNTHISIHEADALKFDFTRLAGDKPLQIVGNLPYNISSPLLFHLLTQHHVIADMVFMLQKEVVDRIVADAGNKTYGRLSVMLQYYCEVEALMTIQPESFTPTPKVESAMIRLRPRQNLDEKVDVNMLRKVVTQSFAQRRKTLRNNLKGLLSAEQIKAVNIDPSTRPEQLNVADFVRLTLLLS